MSVELGPSSPPNSLPDGLPVHASYSSFTSYLKCGYSYWLERAVKVPQDPAWWFLGGGAVHTASEWYDTKGDTK